MNIRKKRFICCLMLIPLVCAGLWFAFLEKHVTDPVYLMHSILDDYIPFIPVFIVPYVLWYSYVAFTAVFLFVKSPEGFIKIAVFLSAGMAIACAAFSLLPNGQALRPALGDQSGPFIDIIRLLYAFDTPVNSAPSIHVIYSVAAYAAVAEYNEKKRIDKRLTDCFLVLSVSCILSTVFIKQHSVIDMTLGLFLSGFLYLTIYKTPLLRPKAPESGKRRFDAIGNYYI